MERRGHTGSPTHPTGSAAVKMHQVIAKKDHAFTTHRVKDMIHIESWIHEQRCIEDLVPNITILGLIAIR
jgi:hypothetical protein